MAARKSIGFICPLSKKGSETRLRSDDVMNSIITPVAEELGYTVQRADTMPGSNVLDDIIQLIETSSIVIADLTELNPNVFYELGLRQATKGKCINIFDAAKKQKIPFDITPYRAYEYNRYGYGEGEDFKNYLKNRIQYLENVPGVPLIKLPSADLIDIYGVTIVPQFLTGAKNHYALAKSIFDRPCKNIFLMQRSSSLILNAEQGWGEEAEFILALKEAINHCGFFYHIITLEGIEAHFNRKNSVFPTFKNFSSNLINVNGNVAVKNDNPDNHQIFYVKKLPIDKQNSLFKLDRQARVLIVEYFDADSKAVIVQNLGDNQTCFLIEGPKAKEYLDICIDFYSTSELVEWNEIIDLYRKYELVERSRGK